MDTSILGTGQKINMTCLDAYAAAAESNLAERLAPSLCSKQGRGYRHARLFLRSIFA